VSVELQPAGLTITADEAQEHRVWGRCGAVLDGAQLLTMGHEVSRLNRSSACRRNGMVSGRPAPP